MANRRWHNRQVFWRRGVSTASEQRVAPAGHPAQTVAQERGRPRRVGARGSHEGPEDQSGSSPQLSQPTRSANTTPPTRAWTVSRLVDAQNAPTAAWKTAQNAVSHNRPRPVLCSGKINKKTRAKTTVRPQSRFTRSQVSGDTSRKIRRLTTLPSGSQRVATPEHTPCLQVEIAFVRPFSQYCVHTLVPSG